MNARKSLPSAALKAIVALAVVLGGISDAAPPALADDTNGNQSFVITATSLDGTGRVVAVGPFAGVGEYRLLSHVENPDGTSTDNDAFLLPDGDVFLRDTYAVTIRPADQSCAWLIDVQGTYVVTGGTGRFAGVTGDGTFTASGVLATGRDDTGQCLGLDSPPLTFHEVVRGQGVTSLP